MYSNVNGWTNVCSWLLHLAGDTYYVAGIKIYDDGIVTVEGKNVGQNVSGVGGK